MFYLTGDTISGTWNEVHEQALSKYPYTCLGTSTNSICTVMQNVTKYINSYSATVNLISYSSKSYQGTLQNTTNSGIKNTIDSWYQENILNRTDSKGQSYASYLSDEVFCNDRLLIDGTGYLLSPSTAYGSYARVGKPILQCPQKVDAFTVSSTKGNGKLTYPIGLLTADEVSLAGGVYGAINPLFYLYSGEIYWLLSPSHFTSGLAIALIWHMTNTGALDRNWSSNDYGVRPVINLSSDVLISGGDGTATNPYTVIK